MKATIVRSRATLADPTDPANHVPLAELYLGVEVAKMLTANEYKALDKEALEQYFRRCEHFYTELCCQLKHRLPLNNAVVKELAFLNPQSATSGSIPSIANVASRFPMLFLRRICKISTSSGENLCIMRKYPLWLIVVLRYRQKNSGENFQPTSTRI